MSKASASPVRLPREQRRAQLIDVALDVFAQHGYAQTTMDEIAQQANVSKPVLYQHFENKRALFFTLIDQQLTALRDKTTNAMQAVDQNTETADDDTTYQAVHAVFEFTADPRGLYRLLMDTTMERPEELDERKQGFLAELVEFVSPYILDNSILDQASSKFVTQGIAATVVYLATRWAQDQADNHDQNTIPLDTAVEHTCRLVAYGATGFDLANNPSA